MTAPSSNAAGTGLAKLGDLLVQRGYLSEDGLKNALTAQKTIAEAVSRLAGPRTCACKDALATAIITRPDHVPDAVKAELRLIIGKYIT